MQFIRVPKAIDIAERVLSELVADWVNTTSVQSINMIVLQQLQVNMLVSWVMEWSKSEMPNRRTSRNFTNKAWATRDLNNHDWFRIIPDPGSQMRVKLSLESICTIAFQARASDVKTSQLGQHSSNRGRPCLVNVFGSFWGTCDQPDKKLEALSWCTADTFSNITNCDIQLPGILMAQKIGQVSLIGCTYDWHDRRSASNFIFGIPPQITSVHLTVDSTILRVSEAHRFKIGGPPEMGDVTKGTAYIWKYPCRIMFQRYVSDHQSNYHCQAANQVQRTAFVGHLPIGIIPFWSCPGHTWDVYLSRFLFAG